MPTPFRPACLCLAILLTACQKEPAKQAPVELGVESVAQEWQAPDCGQAEACASINAEYLRFPGAPALSAQLESRLFQMLEGVKADGGPPPAGERSTESYTQAFFEADRAAQNEGSEMPPFEATLKAEVVSQWGDLVVVELAGYVFTGGAHGMPMTEYLVIDRRGPRQVGLQDMLVEGQRPAFEQALARAYKRWLDHTGQSADFTAQWPPVPTENVAPMAEAVVVKYNVYDIAPYAQGQPELQIPYDELEGVFKARFIPDGRAPAS